MLLGLRTVIYPSPDLAAARAWWSALLDTEPYFDQPFYVGFSVGGYEVGLVPDGDETLTYWGVPDAAAALAQLLERGAAPHAEVAEVGDGIRTASVLTPDGAVLGVIENPHFVVAPVVSPGPGR